MIIGLKIKFLTDFPASFFRFLVLANDYLG